MTSTDRPSVALLTNAPAPYRTPFFNELAKRCRLLVAFDVGRMPGREWELDEKEFEFDWMFARTLSIPLPSAKYSYRQFYYLPLNIVSILHNFRPDVVVSDQLGPRTASATAFCALSKRPLIIWSEGTLHTEDGTSAPKSVIRRKLLRRATRVWGNGEESGTFLAANGVPRSRIDLGMTGADTVRWSKEVEAERGSSRSAFRETHGLTGTVLLFVGLLAPLKGIPELLAAMSIVAEDRDLPQWSVLFVGSGPLAPDIEAWAAAHPAVPVARPGFVQPSELPAYYAAADLFVMPSLIDRWALVCIEALAAGLPQVTSSLNGGAADLVTSEEIGVVADPRDVRSLARHLADRIRLGPQRVPDGLRDRAMSEWSPAATAERAVSSIRAAMDERARTA